MDRHATHTAHSRAIDITRLRTLLQTYDSFHDKPGNRLLHWIGTPPIIVAVIAALWAIPMPAAWPLAHLNPATLGIALSLAAYARLSWRVAIGMGLLLAALYGLVQPMAVLTPLHYWTVVAVLFLGGWGFQFWGHAIQGESPRFVGQPVYLLVGPSALVCQVYDRLGIRY